MENLRLWTGCKRIPKGYTNCKKCPHFNICQDHGAWENCKLQEIKEKRKKWKKR